tara:strand:+ start:123 stop:353 length:231 start_codon:yes stop_codon:yes gene_type:complete
MDKNNILWLVVKEMLEYLQTTEKDGELIEKLSMCRDIMKIIDKQKEEEAIELQPFELSQLSRFQVLQNLKEKEEKR